jgi:[ribosomal protein S5]-alanine N-acetyltransferase
MFPSIIEISTFCHLSHEFVRGDVDSFVEHLKEKQIQDNTLIIPYPYHSSDGEWFIQHCNDEKEKHGKPMNWQIRNEDQKLIGMLSLHGKYGIGSHRDEIGYWLAKPYWNRGIMTTALRRFSDFAFGRYGIVRLEAPVFDFNLASQRVAEKAGYIYEGTLKKAYFKDGKIFDGKLYALVR